MKIFVIAHRMSFTTLKYLYAITLGLSLNDFNGERKKEIKNIGALDSLVLLGWVLPLLDL